MNVGLVLAAGLVVVGAVAVAKDNEKPKGPKLTVVWDGQKWVYAEVTPNGLILRPDLPPPPVR